MCVHMYIYIYICIYLYIPGYTNIFSEFSFLQICLYISFGLKGCVSSFSAKQISFKEVI